MPVFGSSECEWLHALMYFKPADKACPWLSRMWVAAVPWYVSSLLTMTVLWSGVCEWLTCLTIFKPADDVCCWLQIVSGCDVSLCFKSADDACSWLSSWWVAAMPHYVWNLLMMLVWGLQNVSSWLPFCVLYLLMAPTLGSLLIILIIAHQKVRAFFPFQLVNVIHLWLLSL